MYRVSRRVSLALYLLDKAHRNISLGTAFHKYSSHNFYQFQNQTHRTFLKTKPRRIISTPPTHFKIINATPIIIICIIDFYTNIETHLLQLQKNLLRNNWIMCLWDVISHYCLAYIWVCNGFYGKIYCSTILYSIGKYILVGYVYYTEKLSWGVICIMGNIMGGMVVGRIVVRLPRSLIEAAGKPLRGWW